MRSTNNSFPSAQRRFQDVFYHVVFWYMSSSSISASLHVVKAVKAQHCSCSSWFYRNQNFFNRLCFLQISKE